MRWLLPAGALVCACGQAPIAAPDSGPEGFVPHKKGPNTDAGLILGDYADGSAFDPPPPPPPRPDYGNTQTLADAPPPASGGTLAIASDGSIAVAADPDRDRVYVVDTKALALVATLGLLPGDEPGRVVIDGSNRAHVALRRGGALLTIDLKSLSTTRRSVCPAPRGLAWDATTDRVHVACATGELVSFDAAGGSPVRSVMIERDLRDVVLVGGRMFVSKLKSAELVELDVDGHPKARMSPPGEVFAAWRTIVDPNGAIWMLHQRAQGKLQVSQGGYGSRCEPVIGVVLTKMPTDGTAPKPASAIGDAVVSLDVAVAANFHTLVPSLGNAHTSTLPSWHLFDARFPPTANCNGPPPKGDITPGSARQFTAVAMGGSVMLLQSREPATLQIKQANGALLKEIPLSSISREDTGHAMFHSNTSSFLACASCHLEGGEDGRTWTLDFGGSAKSDGTTSLAQALLSKRRTPSLRGTIAGTAPYHWLGDQEDISHLLDDVYSKRMNGGPLADDQKKALESWVGAIPPFPHAVVTDEAARARGQALFSDKGCTSCHTGSKLTDNDSHFVGEPFMLQTPPLIGVGFRAPYLHDGCAKTLANRFDPACRSDRHGTSGALSQADISDLVTYLESL